jgi:O-antigen/teichoic acid export membrane protein
LSADDFGLMAIVMVIVGFSQMFIDMGISNAIIYKQDISKKQLSSLYWLSIIIGFVICGLVIVLAGFIADIYDNKELENLLYLISITFVILPFGQQFMVLMQKKLLFYDIAFVEIIARVLSFVVTIVLAYKNFGVYALVYGTLTYSILSTILFVYKGLFFHKPKLHLSFFEIKEFLSFGFFQLGEKIALYFNSEFDTILIGYLLGTETLGVFNIAKRFVSYPVVLINPIITKVSFPIFAKSNNSDENLSRIYLRIVNNLSYVNFPIYFLIIMLAEPFVFFALGENWGNAIILIQVLAITYMIKTTSNPAGSLALSKGRADITFYWNGIKLIYVPISIYLGSFFGVVGVTFALLSIQVLLFYPTWKFIVNKICVTSLKKYTMNLSKPFLLVMLSGIIPFLLISFFDGNLTKIILGVISFFMIYIALILKYEISLYQDILRLINKRL